MARFVQSIRAGDPPAGQAGFKSVSTSDDEWIVGELNKLTQSVTENLEKYRLGQVAEEVYEFVWHKFADVYIEKVKSRKEEASPTLRHVLITSLKLLHPFMPFVTEVIWSFGFAQDKQEMLITSAWPVVTEV